MKHPDATTLPKTAADKDLVQIIEKAGRTPPSRKWIVLSAIVFLAIVAWLVVGRNSRALPQGPSYATEPLQRSDLSLDITVTGNLEPTNEVTVGSELSGIAQEVFVDTNDQVTLGKSLARLDTSKLEAQIQSSRASLNSAKAKVTQAKATVKESQASLVRLQKLDELSSGKGVSQLDLESAVATADRAEADVLSAEASVEESEAQLRINERDLEKAVIKSPIDGIVLTREIEPGQTVAASFTAPELFVIAENLEHMKLIVTVAEADIGHVREGQNATFTVDAWPDRVYHATVTKVAFGSTLTDNVVTYQTELEVANDDLTLRPGMTATADIKVAEAKNEFIVQNEALRFDPTASSGIGAGARPKKSFLQSLMPGPPRQMGMPKGGAEEPSAVSKAGNYHVWVLREDRPQAVSVSLGIGDERRTVITGEGLSDGMPVILRAQADAKTP
jgi:HlyD family secretion protein